MKNGIEHMPAERALTKPLDLKGIAMRSSPWLILLAWIPLVVTGFWRVYAAESANWGGQASIAGTAGVAPLEAWYRQQSDGDATQRLRIVLVPAAVAACACAERSQQAFSDLQQRMANSVIEFWQPQTVTAAAHGIEVMVFDATRQLVYAGPWHLDRSCGSNGVAVAERFIQAGLSRPLPRAERVYQLPCVCNAAQASQILNWLTIGK